MAVPDVSVILPTRDRSRQLTRALGSALAQRDFKFVIAYSSVSQMGVVMLGAATLTESGLNGSVFQMFANGIMTGLFFALEEKSEVRIDSDLACPQRVERCADGDDLRLVVSA